MIEVLSTKISQRNISIILLILITALIIVAAIMLLDSTRPVNTSSRTSSATSTDVNELYAQPTDYAPLAEAPTINITDPVYTSSKYNLSFQVPSTLSSPTVSESIGSTSCELIRYSSPQNNGTFLTLQLAAANPNCIYGLSTDNGLFNIGNPPQTKTLKSYTLQTADGNYMNIVKQQVLTDGTYRLVAYNTDDLPELMELKGKTVNTLAIYVIARSKANIDSWESTVMEIVSTLQTDFKIR